MKLRWLIVGAAVAVAGGFFVMKHVVENGSKYLNCTENDGDTKEKELFSEYLTADFEESDFLV